MAIVTLGELLDCGAEFEARLEQFYGRTRGVIPSPEGDRRMNITIIDDDKEFADNTAQMLKAHGHKVSVLYTVTKAVPLLAKSKPDLLILDVMFPDNPAAGFDLARELRKREELADLPIIMLTGVNQEFPMGFSAEDIDPAWMPVQDFMEKPVRIKALLEKISGFAR